MFEEHDIMSSDKIKAMVKEEIDLKNGNAAKTFYKLFFLAALFFAVFVLLQLGDNLWAVGAAGIVLLIAGYLFLTQTEKQKQEEKERDHLELDRKLDELLNAERAIYTIAKRGNEKAEKTPLTGYEDAETKELLVKLISLQERILSENRKLAEIQVNALKTVSKYNKENARQIAKRINENTDRIVEQLQNSAAQLQDKIGVSAEQMALEIQKFNQNIAVNAAVAIEKSTEFVSEIESADFVQDLEKVAETGLDFEVNGKSIPEIDRESEDGGNAEFISELDLDASFDSEQNAEEIIDDPYKIEMEPETISIPIPDFESVSDFNLTADPISLSATEEPDVLEDSNNSSDPGEAMSQDDMEELLASLTK